MATRLDILTRMECGWTWMDTSISRRVTDSTKLSFRCDSLAPSTLPDVDIAWYLESQTLCKDASVTYDLTSLAQLIFGRNVTFTLGAVKLLYLYNRSNTGVLNISSEVLTPWTGPFALAGDALNIEPGTPLLLANFGTGWSVDSTAKKIKLTANGNDVLFDIAILGTSPGWNADSGDSTGGTTSNEATSSTDEGGTTSSGETISSFVQ